jgi:hypothetical protein
VVRLSLVVVTVEGTPEVGKYLVGRVFIGGADVTRRTLPILAPAFAEGKLHLVVIAAQEAPPLRI